MVYFAKKALICDFSPSGYIARDITWWYWPDTWGNI